MRGIETSPNTIVVSRRLEWQTAEVAEIVDETPRTRSLILNLPDWPGHGPGRCHGILRGSYAPMCDCATMKNSIGIDSIVLTREVRKATRRALFFSSSLA